MRSLNFEFLSSHEPLLLKLGTAAERYCFDDPNVSLYKLRQFGEMLAQVVARRMRVEVPTDGNQLTLLRSLSDRGVIRGDVDRLFHELRKTGNTAVHTFGGSQRVALECLEYGYLLAGWFYRAFIGDKAFKLAPFVAPTFQDPATPSLETTRLKQEIDRLNQKLAERLSLAELADADRLRQAQQLLDLQQSALDAATEKQQIEQRLRELEEQSQVSTPQTLQKLVNRAVDTTIDLDESATRRLVDRQLQAAGWLADSQGLTYSSGARPAKTVNQAIAEYPIGRKSADYVLFIGLEPIAVIEAKRRRKNVQGALDQAIDRYAKKFPDGPVPFAFATNGKPYQAQIQALSGIWFQDLRRETNRSRAIGSWFTPDELKAMLRQDLAAADEQLTQTRFEESFKLRDYQKAAIQSVEQAIVQQKHSILLAMATGTGKTRTAIALCYRLLTAERFRRILFLVDRSVLGKQTGDAFAEMPVNPTQKFTDIFDLQRLKEIVPDIDTRVQIATVQGLVKRVLYSQDGEKPSAGQYDCIIVDECHRGYTLDREMSEAEMEFRDARDYLSKYRQVLDYFDAVKIGLTATPAAHTAQIFGNPVFYYTYNQAVAEQYLAPYEPPYAIQTALAKTGISVAKGETINQINPVTNAIEEVIAPDDIGIEVEQFNRRVMVPEFNRVVCQQLSKEIYPFGQGKTLIFCVTDLHADEVVKQLEQAFAEQYGEDEIHRDLIKKITGSTDDPLGWTQRFKNEQYPNIVVTVDLLTTGVDIPQITNLVFLRRVNSRILYEQMLGRATRKCDDIGKEAFLVFDAVGVCAAMDNHSTMQSSVVTPKTSFAQLTNYLIEHDLTHAKANLIANGIQAIDQWIAKLQRQQVRWNEERRSQFETLAGMSLEQVTPFLRSTMQQGMPLEGLQGVQTWLKSRAELIEFLDTNQTDPRPILLAMNEDRVVSVTRHFKVAENSADYLERFQAFLRSQNEMVALSVITQRPRELTRSQLQEARKILMNAGFDEKGLEVAWKERTNQDIAASIVGFIRQAAIGDALVPWDARVDRAMAGVLAQQDWTMPQRKWLERIAKQLKVELVVDRSALDQGAFQTMGGFKQGDKVFEGRLAAVLERIGDRLWDGA